MKITPIFLCEVRNNQLIYARPDMVQMYLGSFEGKPVNVSIEGVRKNRSLSENKYYWGVIIEMLSQEFGLTPLETHELLKSQFLRKGVEIKGKRYEVIRSTTKLSTIEFEEFCEKIRNWSGSEHNCVIPLPNEVKI